MRGVGRQAVRAPRPGFKYSGAISVRAVPKKEPLRGGGGAQISSRIVLRRYAHRPRAYAILYSCVA